MSTILEDTDPSENRAAARAAAAVPVPHRVTFNRLELNRILNLYGRMVADGEWRDYAIDFLKDRAVFSVFRRDLARCRLPHRKKSAARAPAGRLQRDLGDRPDRQARS